MFNTCKYSSSRSFSVVYLINKLKQSSKTFSIGKWHNKSRRWGCLSLWWVTTSSHLAHINNIDNHAITRFILKSVWSALYDICLYFLMETKVISIHRTAVKIHVYSKQINQYRAIADHQNLVLPVTILPPQHKMEKKKKKIRQHFIESIHESILLSGKQCTWMKVNDFPASPSNQYSLYKLMLLLNVRSVSHTNRYL